MDHGLIYFRTFRNLQSSVSSKLSIGQIGEVPIYGLTSFHFKNFQYQVLYFLSEQTMTERERLEEHQMTNKTINELNKYFYQEQPSYLAEQSLQFCQLNRQFDEGVNYNSEYDILFNLQEYFYINKAQDHSTVQSANTLLFSEEENKLSRIGSLNPHIRQSANECASIIQNDKANSPKKQRKNISKHIDSSRNIIGYIAKKAINLMMHKYASSLKKQCEKCNIRYNDFANLLTGEASKRYHGPESLTEMLEITEQMDEREITMKKILSTYIEKILRKEYLIHAFRSGKMQDLNAYIKIKNQYLLYFSEHIWPICP